MEIPLLHGVVEVVIGQAEGDGPVFGRVSGVARDPEARIYVADALSNTVTVFGPAGDHLYTFGREGSGPGELQRPCCIAFDPAGRLWVRDGRNARYNAYSVGATEARYLSQVRMTHGDVDYAADLTFDSLGFLIDIGHRSDPATGRRSLYRVHVDSTGSTVEEEIVHVLEPAELGAVTVERSTAGSQSFSYVYPPFGPEQLLAHGAGGSLAKAISSRYEITWIVQGVERRVAIPQVTGPELTSEERAAAMEELAEQLREFGVPENCGGLEVPTHKPPLSELFFDDQGRLWVQRARGLDGFNEADVYAKDGSLMGRRQWPRDISLAQGAVYADEALGVRTDVLGTQQVVRLRFMPE